MLALLCLLAASAVLAQTSGTGASDAIAATGEEIPGALTSWGGLALRYLAVTVVCVCAFTLVFLKCWRDVASEAPEAGEEGSTGADPAAPGGEPSAQPAAGGNASP